jgi:hypothetical protein
MEMGYDTIHETAIADIAIQLKDGVKAVKDEFSKPKYSDLRYSSSIAKAAKGLVLEFPVLVSKSNHIESAAIVAKAYEAKFVTMLQLVFAASNITNAKDGYDFIKKYHANLNEKLLTVDEFINVMDGFVKEGANISAESYAKYKAVTEDMKNLSYYLGENINESSLESYKVFNNYSTLKVVKEQNPPTIDDEVDDIVKGENDKHKAASDDKKQANSDIDLKLKMKRDQREEEEHDEKKKLNALNMMDTQQRMIGNNLLSTDIKKANELTPTMMVVNFIKETPNGPAIPSQVIIGVKAKLYEVEPMDVVNKLITKHVDNNLLLKLVKVSTREISFVKDFLLAIDDAKLSALSKSKRGSANKLFKVLERRAIGGKIRKSLKLNDYTMAISSLVISQEEAEELLKNNIDVSNPKIIRPIMEKLNLISFAIIDESSESVRFIFDTGDDVYETIPFNKLEREQKDGMSKKVINLMAKMYR